jgi:hypothetical protein
MVAAIETCVSFDDYLQSFSPARSVTLGAFDVGCEAVGLETLLGDVYALEGGTLREVCDVLDERLAARGWRLPTEDELEAACGGGLFAWGATVPDGEPYGSSTSFKRHHAANERGLVLNANPYTPELAREAFLLGDGGSALCGGEPWPIAWLTLSPSFRLREPDVEECLFETLGCARVRPVRLS